MGNNEKNNAKNNGKQCGLERIPSGGCERRDQGGTKGADYRRRGIIDIARISPNGFVLQLGANSGLHGLVMREEQGVGGTFFRES